MLLSFSHPVKKIESEKLSQYLKFNISEYDNYDRVYNMSLNFSEEKIIECKIISDFKR